MANNITLNVTGEGVFTLPKGSTGEALLALCSPQTTPILAITVNGTLQDLLSPLENDATITRLSFDDPGGKHTFWHSTAHLLAQAILMHYPEAKLGIGPATKNGFYYDIDFGAHQFSANDLPKIEKTMHTLAQKKIPFQRKKVTKQEAKAFFQVAKNPYKEALIEALEEGTITFYQQGDFTDLCRGPHVPHTGHIKAIKLLTIAGAYWRGDANNPQLTRIYGISFPQKKTLKDFLKQREEATKRDHRQLGKALGLFTFSQEVGLGLPLWLPKGALLRELLLNFLTKKQRQAGYHFVVTPHIAHQRLYTTSGHYDKYSNDSFQPITTPEGDRYMLKPMNCPHHCAIYQDAMRSYKALPLRLAEFGTVYRYEQHGELHGLSRTRCFTQDDGHVFCTTEQIGQEIGQIIDLLQTIFQELSLTSYEAFLSFRDPAKATQYIGDAVTWDQAEAAIRKVVKAKGLPTQEDLGGAAFYGPKIDFVVKDALGRAWQLGTIQLDYQLPQRFELTYTDQEGRQQRPIMIHRAFLGSLERFLALYLEHTNGYLPLWLAPEQIRILPLSDHYQHYATEVKAQLESQWRVTIDNNSESIHKRIRHAEKLRIPYILIVGAEEMTTKSISIRKAGQGPQGQSTLEALITRLKKEDNA